MQISHKNKLNSQKWNIIFILKQLISYIFCLICLYQFLIHNLKQKTFFHSFYFWKLNSKYCESWTIKKAEHQRIDAFELWCWRRLLRVPWTARRSNQSILRKSVLNIHWKYWCWSWNFNTLATWCKELTHLKRPWCWERLKVGGEGDDGGWDGWMASPTRWTWVWVNSGNWWWTGRPGCCSPWGHKESDTTEWLNWVTVYCAVFSHSVVSDSLRSQGLYSTSHSVHRDSLGRNTGAGCHTLLQGIFPTQGLNPGLPQYRWILYHLSHQGSPSKYCISSITDGDLTF